MHEIMFSGLAVVFYLTAIWGGLAVVYRMDRIIDLLTPVVPLPLPEGLAPPIPLALPTRGLFVMKRDGDHWLPVGRRAADHPDVAEALRTPGLAVRHADGHMEYGDQ